MNSVAQYDLGFDAGALDFHQGNYYASCKGKMVSAEFLSGYHDGWDSAERAEWDENNPQGGF